MKIGIAFDLVPEDRGDGPDDRYEEFDKPETVAAIADVIRGEGHDVVLLGDGAEFLIKVLDDRPDFVFNIAEGEGVGRCREARVPAVLEMLGIPYSGSDPLTLAAAMDKGVARRLVRDWGVEVPLGFSISDHSLSDHILPDQLSSPFPIPSAALYPLILKPSFEGSSKGIRDACLAFHQADLERQARSLAVRYSQPILIEQFISGDEITVGIIGDGPSAEAIGVMRVVPREPIEHFVYSLEVKRDWRNCVVYESPAGIDDDATARVVEAAMTAYRALGCRDVARIDFRIKDGSPYFIEANPLPGLAPGTSDLVILARGYGIGYEDLILRILNTALARVGLASPEVAAP